MQKICFFNTTKAWGGGEKWHFDVSGALQAQGFKVLYVTSKGSEQLTRLEKSNVPYFIFRVKKFSYLNPVLIWKLKRFFEKQQIHTIIMNLSVDLKVAGIAAKWAGVERIIYRRGSAIPIKNRLYNRLLFKHIVTDIIANSEATKHTILENNSNLFDASKIQVIYNGLEFNKHQNTSEETIYKRQGEEIIIGHAGRMAYQKGHEFLVDIASELKKTGLNFKLLLAGSGPLENAIRQKVKLKGLEEQVIFLGFVDSISQFMLNLDIFVLTSRWEGFGFVIAEAMAAKKPVVAFNISSNPELVTDNETGYLVKPFHIEEFAGKINMLAASDTLRQKFGQKAYEVVHEKFTFSKTLENVKQMLKLKN
ncbi:MAG: glycosyltransferase [Bacteroidales bacterium]|nr:glycosyltransferase [Bacteroidales bacterium]MBN2819578.1 glycosyltransferase [Bacteroidales bacterium]